MSELAAWFELHRLAIWTVVLGAICNSACAILGCYLVLRRMSMLGDAISHAILPGIVVAFLFTGMLGSWPVFVGALVVGVLTAFLTQSLHGLGNVSEDSSMGVVFTSLFALGVFLIRNFADRVHLDADCALYGQIDLIAFDRVVWGGLEFPRALFPMGLALLAAIVFVICFWKELKLVSFDPALATAMGISAGVMHYLLMAMVAAVTVAAFEAVGSILVIAMLIVPGATAHLLTDRLWQMIVWSVVIAVLSAVLGYWGAVAWNTSVAGMMCVAAGAQFALAVVLAPRHGLLGKAIQRLQLSLRIVGEDLVAMLYRTEELATTNAAPELHWRDCIRALGGGWVAWLSVPQLRLRGDVQITGSLIQLTDQGRRLAQSLVRSHRLWEAFLVKHFHLPLDHVHEPAERIEHYIGPQLQERLAAELRDAGVDPHGREIPPATRS
ncbi:MAG: metal ABC transporter permease [Planctomycetaceae bacterium]|nr:metal ABC transporter permease [Planctomycetaceae bacterium]